MEVDGGDKRKVEGVIEELERLVEVGRKGVVKRKTTV